MPASRAFFDISIDGEVQGRIVSELFTDEAPKACENFLALCNGSHSSPDDPSRKLSYKSAPFHRITRTFMVQGGDITHRDGTGGTSIFGHDFADEALGSRDVDAPGLLCMANRGKDTNNSQFFITLADCPHLNGKQTVFGRVVQGQEVLNAMERVEVDDDDKPKVDVLIARCGELERRTKKSEGSGEATARSEVQRSRGRKRRRREESLDGSGDEEQRKSRRRSGRKDGASDSTSSGSGSDASSDDQVDDEARQGGQKRQHRRSDASLDATRRGRSRRSRSNSSLKKEALARSTKHRHDERRDRNLEPSRHQRRGGHEESEHRAGHGRRQRSLPNQYDKHGHRHGNSNGNSEGKESRHGRLRDDEDDERMRWEEWEREGGDARYEDAMDEQGRLIGTRHENGHGRLGRDDDDGRMGGGPVKFKGRGLMKYRS